MRNSPCLIPIILSLGFLVSCDRLAVINKERAAVEAEYVALVAEQQGYDRQINQLVALSPGGSLEQRANTAQASAAMYQAEQVRYANAISAMEAAKKTWRAKVDEFKAKQNQ